MNFLNPLIQDITCGYCDCAEYGSLKQSDPRTVVRFEIEYFLDDAIWTSLDGVKHEIKRDHILIAKPHQERFSRLPFTTCFLKFQTCGDLALLLSSAPDYFPALHPQKIRSLLNDIVALNESGQKNELILASRIFEVLNVILSDAEIPAEQNMQKIEICERAKDFIKRHWQEDINLSVIARSVNLSSTYFHNVFTSTLNITPHDYLLEIRLSNAKRMLWESQLSIGEIAEKCGFGSQQYFTKVLKKSTGSSPGYYRKTFRQKYQL